MPLSLKETARRLWHEHTSPLRLAAAVGCGVVVGCSPFYGFHFWIGLGLAFLLRLNKVAVFLGSQISMPLVAPALGFASVQLGAQLLHEDWLRLGLPDFALSRLPSLLRTFFLAWLVGGLLVGLSLGMVAFLVTGLIAKRRADARDGGWSGTLRQVLERYRGAPRGHRGYLTFKLRMDPVYRAICDGLGSTGTVLDLGTGLGVLPVLLALRGQARESIGLDWDEEKVRSARLAAEGLPGVHLEVADVRTHELPEADAVLIIDLLHYFDIETQRQILHRAVSALRPGGRLAVRETERRRGSILTRALEGLAVRSGWNRGPGLCYRSADEMRADLEELGLRCGLAPSSSALHKGNYLLWGESP